MVVPGGELARQGHLRRGPSGGGRLRLEGVGRQKYLLLELLLMQLLMLELLLMKLLLVLGVWVVLLFGMILMGE